MIGYRLCDEHGRHLESQDEPWSVIDIDTQNPYGLNEVQQDVLSRRLRDAAIEKRPPGHTIPLPGSRCVLKAELFLEENHG